MSVIVRDMNMPTGCVSCVFAEYLSDHTPYCRRLMATIQRPTQRLEDCPLSPLTPLEKAREAEGRVNYCDECEHIQIIGNAPYCKVDGKMIHPIMLTRGQGTGPAWNCKKRLIQDEQGAET